MKKPASFLRISFTVAVLVATAVVPLSGVFAARPAATSPVLGAAASFSVLAGTAVTNVPTSAIGGDVGLSPAAGSNYAGLTAAEVLGTIYAVDATGPAGSVNNPALLTTAKTDLVSAYDALSAGDNAACTTDYGAVVQDLTGLSLVPGVYCANAFTLSGTLTLSGSGVWVFRSAATLITSGTANIVGGDACNVWWRVASSATLGTNTSLKGNILALTSIGLASGASLDGRALARNGAVTLDHNAISGPICAAALTPTVTSTPIGTATPIAPPTPAPAPPEVPEAGSFLLMASGLGGLATWLGWQRAKRGRSARP
jgi:hypothetical protein